MFGCGKTVGERRCFGLAEFLAVVPVQMKVNWQTPC